MVDPGAGVGMLTQNLVLAAQNDVRAADLDSTTSVLSFSRSMGGTVGTAVLGAVLAHRATAELDSGGTGTDGTGASGTSENAAAGHGVPDMTALPAPARSLVEHAYASATAELFLCATRSHCWH